VLFALLIFVIPNIKGYKYQKRDLKVLELQNQKLLDRERSLRSSIELFKKDNGDILSRFDKEFKESEFREFCKKFFTDVEIKKVANPKKDNFLIYRVSVRPKSNSPKDFYKFIDELSKEYLKAKIDFPIELSLKNGSLFIDFVTKIYKKSLK
jgi:hypothetical protein